MLTLWRRRFTCAAVLAGTVALVCLVGGSAAAERINHAGRILPPLPVITNAVLFNTPEADAILAAMQIFPRDHPWNEDISRRPVLSNSAAMMYHILTNFSSSRRTLRAFMEMNFVLVPTNQPLVPIDFFNWPDESDSSPYPIPPNLPVEGWPATTGILLLDEWQRDINNAGGDRHSIIVQPGTGFIWETWLTKRVGTNWEASNGAKFNLNSNALRPAGWTSGDAAGLAMFPALVRYDECERGEIEHALRLIVKRTRLGPIYPATHHASVPATSDPNVPAMGQRLRLKSSFTIPSNWTWQEQAVLRALKKYGAIVADNGNFFSFSITPDGRWPSGAFDRLSSVSITNFEVIQTTGSTEGPRSPGAPSAHAGPDGTADTNVPVTLQGAVSDPDEMAAVQWRLYSGPGSATFADASRTNTTVTFSTNGVYTLLLAADDGAHSVAYDAVVITAGAPPIPTLTAARNGGQIELRWSGGTGPFVIESKSSLDTTNWTPFVTTNASIVAVPLNGPAGFFRVLAQ